MRHAHRSTCLAVGLLFVVTLWPPAVLTTTGADGSASGEDYSKSIRTSIAPADPNRPPGYTIVTTSEIQRTSTKLGEFVTHKRSLGFAVQVVTEADFGGGIGDEAAENIRAWLQNHYVGDNIEYVLLIGDPRPDIGEIPMKMLWADKELSAPSDVYYADLSGNWDLDGDTCYGEWGDDFGPGGVDRNWEVMVGRIPCYRAESGQFPYAESVQDVDNILRKTIDYEDETESGLSIDWRRNALLAMTLGDAACRLGEAICNDILVPAGWTYHRIYQDDYVDANNCGLLDPPPETTPCTPNDVCAAWRHDRFGLAVWWGHGGTTVDAGCDPNNQYPSFAFQVACDEAYPENPQNLAYALLKSGVVCTVASTRWVWSAVPEPVAGSSNAASMAYEYVTRLVVGMTAGQALYGTKQALPQRVIPYPTYWINFFIFNIYGDPALSVVSPEERIVYVDATAAGANDGSSWPDAYNHLQDALAVAVPGDQIRVAHGTYRPDEDSTHPSGTDDATATFKLKNGVVVRGGYAGLGAVDQDTRDTSLFETVLSGDIGAPDVNNDDSYHVVFAPTGACEATVLDGVTVRGGHARESNPDGGGLYVELGYPTVIDCMFTRNRADGQGGGVCNAGGTVPLFTRCTFVSNEAWGGGGMYSIYSSPLLTNCTFIDNSANDGGGMYSIYSDPELTSCTISHNSAGRYGGGLHNEGGSMILANCIVSGNSACWGAGMGNNSSRPYLGNCTFSANRAWGGGGLFNCFTTATLSNCIMWGDRPDEISDYVDAVTVVSYSDIEGDWSGEGEYNISENPEFADGENEDYHLKSQAGRWNDSFEAWQIDKVDSPCIDAGDPLSPVGDEPEPNGGRINMGAYGGTGEASKSL
ncbi:MAG: hypothetical protein JW993_20060 [Sedimentisphaerales bacterium]|nr:hypothetical protein [Sedimentisphaerales bacterium]